MSSTLRLLRIFRGAKGETATEGVELTDAEVLSQTEAGPSGFAVSGLVLPYDICHDYSGNLYISDNIRHVIVKVAEGGEVRWIAGSRAGVSGNNGTLNNVDAADARFDQPKGICCDKYGNLYVADYGNNQIRVIRDGKVSVLAGTGVSGLLDGDGATAQFNGPADVAVDKAGVVYVADFGNHAIRKVKDNGAVVTIAGNGNVGDGLAESGEATAITSTSTTWPSRRAMFNSPDSVSVDNNGNVYVWDVGNIKLKKITPDGQVHLHSGSGVAGLSLGTGSNKAFTCQYTYLYAMDNDESGNLYAVDFRAAGRSRVLKIDYNGVPGVIADFDSNSYNTGPWSLTVTPGQALFIGLQY